MEKRTLGRSGIEVSAMGVGCMSIAGTPGRPSLALVAAVLVLSTLVLGLLGW